MNLKELAQHLGLSQTTVSRALADYADVAPATRKRVRLAAAAHGYRPNAHARSLAMGRSNVIAVLLVSSTADELSRTEYGALKHICKALTADGFDPVVAIQDAEGGLFGARFLQAGTIDGAIVLSFADGCDAVKHLSQAQIPYVGVSIGTGSEGFQLQCEVQSTISSLRTRLSRLA